MTPPATLKIAGFTFDVRLDDNEHFADSYMGRCNVRDCHIVLAADLKPDQMRETLLHEALHAVETAVGAGLTEGQVTAVSRGLYALLRDNPDFAKYLTD